MPQYKKGDMFETRAVESPGITPIVTTNSYINSNGQVVMGRGVAKAARDRYPGLDTLAASRMKQLGVRHLGVYGLMDVKQVLPNRRVIDWLFFQVKKHFRDSASTYLIKQSAESLEALALEQPDKEFWLPFPGIGNGKLDRSVVMPLIEDLPDNVIVWELS